MLSFKQRNYTTLERTLSDLLSTLNKTPVSPALASYIDGIPADEIRPEQVLQRQKEDKANAIPGAKDFRKAGIDLTLTIPDCPVSDAQLDAIATLATVYQPSHMHRASSLVSYSQKAGKWQVSTAGNQALAAAITTLTGAEEKTYTLTVQLFEHVAKHSPDLLPTLFPAGKQGPRGNELNHEWLVDKIQMYRKK
jgi:hypothetical protein